MENTSGEEKWSREELIKFCIDCMKDIEDGDMEEYRRTLEGFTWEELDKEANWIWGLTMK